MIADKRDREGFRGCHHDGVLAETCNCRSLTIAKLSSDASAGQPPRPVKLLRIPVEDLPIHALPGGSRSVSSPSCRRQKTCPETIGACTTVPRLRFHQVSLPGRGRLERRVPRPDGERLRRTALPGSAASARVGARSVARPRWACRLWTTDRVDPRSTPRLRRASPPETPGGRGRRRRRRGVRPWTCR